MGRREVVAGAVGTAAMLGMIVLMAPHASRTAAAPGPAAAVPASPSAALVLPTAAPAPSSNPRDAQLLSAAIDLLARPAPLHVQFTGIDAGGQLSFDVVADGTGDLTGTYTREGQTAQITVVGTTIYMRGAAALQNFTGLPPPGDSASWVRVTPGTPPGILATVSAAHLLSGCMHALATQLGDGWIETAPQIVNGTSALTLTPHVSPPRAWMFALDATSHQVVSVDYTLFNAANTPADCAGGESHLLGPTAGVEGTFSFGNATATAGPITAPHGWIPYPPIQEDPDS